MGAVTISDDDALWRRFSNALHRAEGRPGGTGRYPALASAFPLFIAVELAGSHWQLLGSADPTPQDARDNLAHQFLERASRAAEGSDLQGHYRAAAEVLDWERHDEMTVVGRRFRIARIERVMRLGADGPEPPRPTDGHSVLAGGDRTGPRTGGAGARAEQAIRFIGEADSDVGWSSAVLRSELRESRSKADTVPAEMIADERRARAAYPGLVLLGVRFAIAEQTGGTWGSFSMSEHATPADARDSLIHYFRDTVPAWEKPGEAACAAFAAAADVLQREHGDDVLAAGRRFRISRVEQVVRMGEEGPEPPRPSDFDPYPPPAAQVQGASGNAFPDGEADSS
jgi:hypothetical protein